MQQARIVREHQEVQRQAQLVDEAQRQAARVDAERTEHARVEALRREAQLQERAREDARAQQDAARQAADRAEAARQDALRQDAARQLALVQESERGERAKQDAARQTALAQESARRELQRQEQEQARQEQAKQALAKQDQQRRDQAEREREDRLRAIGQQLNAEAALRDRPAPAQPTVSALRRGWLFGRADQNADLVLYAEAMSRKIQMNMTFDIVREAVRQAHTAPIVTVAVRADGSVEKVIFVVSSGVPAIDEAVRKVVASQAPYPPFSPALARQYDVIEIRRTWIFDIAIRLQ